MTPPSGTRPMDNEKGGGAVSAVIKGTALGVAMLFAWLAAMALVVTAIKHFEIAAAILVVSIFVAAGIRIVRYLETRP